MGVIAAIRGVGGRFGEKRGTTPPHFTSNPRLYCVLNKELGLMGWMCWPGTLMPGPEAPFPARLSKHTETG